MTGKVLFNATKQSEDREPGLAKMVGSIKSWVAKKKATLGSQETQILKHG